MPEQLIMNVDKSYGAIEKYLKECKVKKILLVCGQSIRKLKINEFFDNLERRIGIKVVRFCEFFPNPTYESVVLGVHVFQKNACDMVIAVGGGSAMDVAKCIKLYSTLQPGKNYLEQKIIPNGIKLVAIPTTAGTGSESTHFAVIYYHGEKQSVADVSCIPSAVFMDATVLESLPLYQRKATMMDAFCHAIESFWSVNSTKESKKYSHKAIELILEYKDLYLENSPIGNEKLLLAANLAGKAINITQTTAGHAMCYKLTSLYGISHGHAAALCVAKLWTYMINHIDLCKDLRGCEYLNEMFTNLTEVMGAASLKEAASKFQDILDKLELSVPEASEEEFKLLKESVNPVRLKNHPIKLDKTVIEMLYRQILNVR